MFMFRRKRTSLIKRLLKSRAGDEASSSVDVLRQNLLKKLEDTQNLLKKLEDPQNLLQTLEDTQNLLKKLDGTQNLLKKLEDTQLELLVAAVEARGADLSDCVLLPRTAGDVDNPPHVLCCQVWRWSDVRHAHQLKQLPVCASSNDPVYTCCNPYHWSLRCETEPAPPPYSRFAMDQLRPEDRAPSEIPLLCGDRYPGSLTTSGEGGGGLGSGGEWCRLAYWELTMRVGQQFPVRVPAIAVFENEPRGNGLCLATLQHQHQRHTPPDSVLRTRAKIGHGVILSLEEDGVWAYNISNAPIFINSPTLTSDMMCNSNASLCVYRVPPGHCVCIHNPDRSISLWNQHLEHPTGPVDPNSIRISFVKGWGPNYSRQEITACPCWLEVLLAPCRLEVLLAPCR